MESWPPSFSVFWLYPLLACPLKTGLRNRVPKVERTFHFPFAGQGIRNVGKLSGQESRPPSSWWSAFEVKLWGVLEEEAGIGRGLGPRGCLTPELLYVTSNGTCPWSPDASPASALLRPPLHGYQSPSTLRKQPIVVLDVNLLSSWTWFSFSVLMQVEKVLL